MTRISVVIPKGQLQEMCRALRTSQRVIAEDIAYTRRERSCSDRIALRTAQPTELTTLLDQLSGPANRDREASGEFEPLRAAACDALVSPSDRLAAVAHGYWNCGASLRLVERQLAVAAEAVALLRALETARTAAASQPPTVM